MALPACAGPNRPTRHIPPTHPPIHPLTLSPSRHAPALRSRPAPPQGRRDGRALLSRATLLADIDKKGLLALVPAEVKEVGGDGGGRSKAPQPLPCSVYCTLHPVQGLCV